MSWRPFGFPSFWRLLHGRRGIISIAKGSDARVGVPWVSASLAPFAWQAWVNVHCRGVGLAPWRPLGLRLFQPFTWQAWDKVHCQGVGYTPWRPFGSPRLWRLLHGRRAIMYIAKGSDVRPSVPLDFRLFGAFCVAGVGQCTLPRGRMYGLASLWVSASLAAFAWQAWVNRHRQGVGCIPWRPFGSPPLWRLYVAGVG